MELARITWLRDQVLNLRCVGQWKFETHDSVMGELNITCSLLAILVLVLSIVWWLVPALSVCCVCARRGYRHCWEPGQSI